MTWYLAVICGILFILLVWLAILTIEFNYFKSNTEYKLEQIGRWCKMNRKDFECFKEAARIQFQSLDKKYKKRKVAKKKEKK